MLKNLKSLFIVQDDEQEKKENNTSPDGTPSEKEPSTNTEQKSKIVSNNAANTKPLSNTGGVIDAKIVEKLLQAIEKNNLEGFDYLEYKKSLKALEKMPMDEATKFRSAFATAATMGVTLDKLLDTVKFYIGILDKENDQFVGAFKSQFNDKVSGREREVTQFEQIIAEKSKQIQQLTAEITKHQTQIQELKQKLEEDNSKIQKTQNDFQLSYTHLKKQFEDDVTKMQQYLK